MRLLIADEQGRQLMGPLPDTVEVQVLPASDAPMPADAATVEFRVPPLLGGADTVALAQRMPGLRVVQLLSAGADAWVGQLSSGVTLCDARGVHDVDVAEWVVAAILSSLRRLDQLAIAQHEHRFAHADVGAADELSGKRVLIVGTGSIGQAVAVLPARTSAARAGGRCCRRSSLASRSKPWKPRRVWLDDYIETSMCQINADARERHDAKSLALIKPKDITDLVFENHPGWTPDEQRKIDKYVAQPELYNPREKTPLQPPRFKGRYRYRCFEATCRGHEQGLLDWEFVMLQRQLAGSSDEHTCAQLREKFLVMMCAPDRDTAFFVGNQAKRVRVFSVLGVYYPRR